MNNPEQVLILTNCDNEPIHIPGAVQGHGMLVAINIQNGLISYLSENLHSLTGIEAKRFLSTDPDILFDSMQLENLDVPLFLKTLLEKIRKGIYL